MPALLVLLKNALLSRHEDAAATLKRHAALANEQPEATDAQAVAAYYAWVAGENELALKFAKKADSGPIKHFHALLVLTAIHAEGTDSRETYRYAKRLSAFDQPSCGVNAVAKSLFGLLPIRRSDIERAENRIDELSNSYHEWVTWAQEFVHEYERTRGDA
jgi:hypothetical protein